MSQPNPERTPVLVAVGQSIERENLTSAVEMAARAAESAFDEAPALRDRVDRITVVAISFSRCGPDPAQELAAALGIRVASCELSSHGGNMPQFLVNRAAEDIAAGRLGTTLIAGAEATRSLRVGEPDANFLEVANANIDIEKTGRTIGPTLEGILGKAEVRAGMSAPSMVYPMFESVLAKRAGRSHAEQRAAIAPLMARFTEVASRNPYAWFPKAQTADEIATVTGTNRLIAEPYNRSMNSFPNVDQGAALLLTNLAIARELGLDYGCVFPWSGAAAKELPPAARPDLGTSEAMTVTSRLALEAAGIGADDCAHIDLYSCFPVAVEVAAAGLGIEPEDNRELTVTGGTPVFRRTREQLLDPRHRLARSTHSGERRDGVRERERWLYVEARGGSLRGDPAEHGLPPFGFVGGPGAHRPERGAGGARSFGQCHGRGGDRGVWPRRRCGRRPNHRNSRGRFGASPPACRSMRRRSWPIEISSANAFAFPVIAQPIRLSSSDRGEGGRF